MAIVEIHTFHQAAIAQLVEYHAHNLKVQGSIPSGGSGILFAYIDNAVAII